MSYVTTTTLGEARGAQRLWLEGRWLARAGFGPGDTFTFEADGSSLVLRVHPQGTRKVSTRRDVPVIDINCRELYNIFGESKSLRVTAEDKVIKVGATRIALLMRSRELVPREASLFTGGGLLSHAAKLAGFEPVMGCEINSDYADTAVRNHPNMKMFNTSVEEVSMEEMAAMRPIGVATLGIPCESFSQIRRLDRGGQIKRDKTLPPEAHHDGGDMFHWALRAIEALNPHTVIIEEVPAFLKAGAGYVTQRVLQRLGYNVEARVIDPTQHGEITGRKRAVIIATTGRPVAWPEPAVVAQTLKEFLDPGPHDWFDAESKSWVFKHWATQTAKGNGFAPPRLTAATKSVPTISKRYLAGLGDQPVVAHPTKPDVCRWFTLNELKRIHGLPANYDLGAAKTTAGEQLCQGVLVKLFERLIRRAVA